VLQRARSLNEFSNRIQNLENKIEKLEKIADENDSLWQMLDEQREMDNLFVGTAEEFEEEFTDIMIRSMKPRGDA
jgi:predicted DNA binding CopG/RHH family protein